MGIVRLETKYPKDYRAHPVLALYRGGRRVAQLPIYPEHHDDGPTAAEIVQQMVVEGMKASREFAGDLRAAIAAGEEQLRLEAMKR